MFLLRVAADIRERQNGHREARRHGFFGRWGLRELRPPGLTDLKRTALVAGIAAVLGLAYPVRNAIRSLGTVFPNLKGYAVPVVVVALIVGLLVIAIPLVFLFALYRDDAVLRISKRLRHLALLDS